MQTECSVSAYDFPASCGRRVQARFDGGRMSSDGGVILGSGPIDMGVMM